MKKAMLYGLAMLWLASYMVSCSSRDQRDEIRAQNGDPDEILTLGKDQFWRETWFYYEAATIDSQSVGVAYQFRKNAGCGAFEDVYLYGPPYYINNPPTDSTSIDIFFPNPASNNPLSPF